METKAAGKKSLQTDPQYFGAFANIARHNVYKILYEIAESTGLSKPATEESLHKCSVIKVLNASIADSNLNEGKINRPDKCLHVIKLLNKHFRFLALLNKSLHAENQDPANYYEMMRLFLDQLDAIRNQYTHAINKKQLFNSDLISKLEIVFDEGLPVLKERFRLDEKEIDHLRRFKRDKKTKKAKKNTAFEYIFYKNQDITEKGLSFFICLFLEPEYTYLFLKKLKGFREENSKAAKVTLEAYTVSRCKLPENKLQSTGNDRTALLLDMLNELQRCPKELFDTLSPVDQEKFRTDDVERIEEPEADEEENKTLLLRKRNRFPYFAMRYIDHTAMFEKLRFQVDLGNYHYHSYNKEMDDQNIVRRWEKKLLSFGKLHEISENAKQEWGTLIKDPAKINDSTPVPFIVQTQAHYHFSGGEEKNIALKDISNTKFVELPKLETGKEGRTKTQEADYYLCTDELPGLLLYNYFVERYKGKNAEAVILSFKEKKEQFLNEFIRGKIAPIEKEKVTKYASSSTVAKFLKSEDFAKEYRVRKEWLAKQLSSFGLEPHQVPETLCKYLLGIEPVNVDERAEQIIQFHIEETNVLLRRAGGPGSEEDKKSKKILRQQQRNLHLSAGDSALFLAKDMLYLQPPVKDELGNVTPKGKANPDEFQLLQARLAYFGVEKENLERTFKLCKLIDSENPHPFLNRINWKKCNESLTFYIQYLEERKRFFETLIKEKNFADYYFLTGQQKVKDRNYFISLAEQIKVKPVNLPRGLFKDALITLLQQKEDPTTKTLFDGENTQHNVVYLINELFKKNDLYQPFYDWRRNYRTVDEWIDDRPGDRKPLNKKYKSPKELAELANEIQKSKEKKNEDTDLLFYTVYKKKVIENEKMIRHCRASDQMLFLMCKDILGREDDKVKEAFKGSFYLHDISPESPKSILETRVTFAIPVETDSRQTKYVEEEFKVKNYGIFRKYLKDKRLGSLLEYYDKEKVRLSELKEQMSKYERYRLILFDTIYQFEKACDSSRDFEEIINAEMSSVDEYGNVRNYMRHFELIKQYAKLYNQTDEVIQLLRTVRNAFSHNQFPAKNSVWILLQKNEKSFLDQIMEFVLSMYISFTEQLNLR